MIFITQEEELQFNLPLQYLYFYASWIPYHKKNIVMISEIEKKYQIPFYAIDVDQFTNQYIRFNISSIPAIIIFKNDKEVERIINLISTDILNNIYADICMS